MSQINSCKELVSFGDVPVGFNSNIHDTHIQKIFNPKISKNLKIPKNLKKYLNVQNFTQSLKLCLKTST